MHSFLSGLTSENAYWFITFWKDELAFRQRKKKSFIVSMVFKYLHVIAPAWIKCLAFTNYFRLQGPYDTGNISEKSKYNTKQKFLGWKYDRKQSLTLEISEGATDRCSSEKHVLESVAKFTGQHMLWVVAYPRGCVGCGHIPLRILSALF